MKKLVVFSGAGMSAESGINTFRDSNGLWEQYRIEEVATPEAWSKNPELVQRFYNERRKNILDAEPNAAHQAIASLEDNFNVEVITQNIDDLHERAGSKRVLHLHGNIRLAKTSGPDAQYTEEFYPVDGWELDLQQHKCRQGYSLRPHVVWFGEAVPTYEQAIKLARQADIFIVIGSTLSVYPVAALVNEIPAHCEAYYIDPKADHVQLPEQYQLLSMTATEGMRYLTEKLKRL
ncbi:NAD-dependent deacylase [Acinetobacter radioresistens]|uniref:SIR2 family NAD-dependent protein deacylase n=1 Tax=Acinetobacter TaxID=469 RepID=UPI0004799133|nr:MULTISPECIES: NAD-dependent deacylase [Acinetobacter]MCU4516573.1 NAD-dependent deacylase [Acinetobacter radioresistens]PKD82544.1 NAD-dependent deacylase [Acinetobacter radioresistens]RSO67392.1 NAD-dependent deacylase [Acinetobacter radioresistens]